MAGVGRKRAFRVACCVASYLAMLWVLKVRDVEVYRSLGFVLFDAVRQSNTGDEADAGVETVKDIGAGGDTGKLNARNQKSVAMHASR